MGLTNEIKSTLLQYYKWKIHALMVGTEIETNSGIADILVMTRKEYVFEIEIKISISDLKNELKKTKHKISSLRSPNKYYFCVPTNILQSTIEISNQLNPKYGVLEYKPNILLGDRINIIKQADWLHKNIPDYKYRMIQRINNDLCKKYSMLYPCQY